MLTCGGAQAHFRSTPCLTNKRRALSQIKRLLQSLVVATGRTSLKQITVLVTVPATSLSLKMVRGQRRKESIWFRVNRSDQLLPAGMTGQCELAFVDQGRRRTPP